MTHAVHGGDILSAVERHGGTFDEYLDFSANINPLGPPNTVLAFLRERAADARALARYPDQYYRHLREVLARRNGCENASVVVANGTAALFDAIVRALRPRSCLLPIPAFSEYQRVLDSCGTTAIHFPLHAETDFCVDVNALESALEEYRPELCVLTNPHNPSGSLIHADDLRRIMERARSLDIPIVIDEAFIDYALDHSLTHAAPHLDNTIVMRSLTKFYAIPAMRVGYAVTTPQLAARIAAHVPSWSISTLAADAACAALNDDAYEHETRACNERERTRLSNALRTLGAHVFPAYANFLLIRIPHHDPAAIISALAERHRIIVRDCASYKGLQPGYLRIAVLGVRENDRLIEALRTSF